MIVPFILAHNLLTILEAQLGKPKAGHELLFIAAIDISLSFYGRFTIGESLVSRLTYTQRIKRVRGPHTYQAPAYSLLSGTYISPALSPGGRELRRPVNKGRLYYGGRIDLRRYGSERLGRDSIPDGPAIV